jgi:hypothetical protein
VGPYLNTVGSKNSGVLSIVNKRSSTTSNTQKKQHKTQHREYEARVYEAGLMDIQLEPSVLSGRNFKPDPD